MSTVQRRGSFLHLQMGQEVIYILMSCALLAAIMLLAYAFRADGSIARTEFDYNRAQQALEKSRRDNEELTRQNRTQKKEMDGIKEKLRTTEEELHAAKAKLRRITEPPPIIRLTEAEGYNFPSGSTELSAPFRDKLWREVAPRLIETSRTYGADVVEVIGHTDEVPVSVTARGRANLDSALLDALNGRVNAATLVAYDNVGLGIGRAAAVATFLTQLLTQPDLSSRLSSKLIILPLSAGSTINIDDSLARGIDDYKDVAERRRIEIRVRRRTKAAL